MKRLAPASIALVILVIGVGAGLGLAHSGRGGPIAGVRGSLGSDQGYLLSHVDSHGEHQVIFFQWVRTGSTLTGEAQFVYGEFQQDTTLSPVCTLNNVTDSWLLKGAVDSENQVSVTLTPEGASADTWSQGEAIVLRGSLEDSALTLLFDSWGSAVNDPAGEFLDPGMSPRATYQRASEADYVRDAEEVPSLSATPTTIVGCTAKTTALGGG